MSGVTTVPLQGIDRVLKVFFIFLGWSVSLSTLREDCDPFELKKTHLVKTDCIIRDIVIATVFAWW